jgi:ribosomal protein S18 acetylase RimI-like enzyme
MSAVTPLQRTSIDRAAITLERAFSPDPMFTWVFPDAATRPAALRRLLCVSLEYGLRYGRVTTSHDAKAACVWIPPGPGITIPRMIRSGMLGVPLRTGLGPFAKFMAANEIMNKIHKARVPEPHFYLVVVGVDPELQGQGVGSAIVREGLARADRESKPCYLETSEPRKHAFYERLGFAVLEETPLGKGGPPAWAMRRKPQPTTA